MSSLFSIMSIDPLQKRWLQIQLSQGSLKGIHKPLTISAYFYQLHDNEKMKSRMYLCFRIEQIDLGQNIDVEDLRVSCSIY